MSFLIALASIGCILYWLQFTTRSICCGDFDGYYHTRLSRLMWEGLRNGDFPPSFIWLPLTTLNARDYADQHFLFHLFLVPFTWFGDLTRATKIAVVLFSTSAVISCYWLPLRYRVRHSFLFLLALMACPIDFWYRLNMTRASSLSIIYLVIATALLFERKYVWLAPLGFLYAWTYNLFLFLGVIAVLWVAAAWWSRRSIESQALCWAAGGMIAGMVINPYFPHDFQLLFEHVFVKAGQNSIAAGNEWYAYPSWLLLKRTWVASGAMVIGYLGCGYLLGLEPDQRHRTERPLFFLLFSGFLLLITIRSARFAEYWPPFAVLFVAFTLSGVWDVRSELRHAVAKEEGREHLYRSERTQMWRVTAVAVVLAAITVHNLSAARGGIAAVEANKTPDHYYRGTKWVQDHLPVGALIYNVNWWDFPKLFFYDTDHVYVAGLDPRSVSSTLRHRPITFTVAPPGSASWDRAR